MAGAHKDGRDIEVRGLCYAYASRIVLDRLDMDVRAGEIVGVVGGSGSGKSTLIKCMSGLLSPDSGSIILGGRQIVGASEREIAAVLRSVGYVFQYSALFDSLTVFENIALAPMRRRGCSRQRARDMAREKLAMVQLEPGVEDLFPSQLSGGMAKRVGLARALALEPDVLFYDEPTSGLDPPTARSIDDLIAAMRTELSVTSVVVSHDVTALARIADRICLLDGGQMVFVGSPDEFVSSEDPRVSRFVRARADLGANESGQVRQPPAGGNERPGRIEY